MAYKKVEIPFKKQIRTADKEFSIEEFYIMFRNNRLIIPDYQRTGEVWSRKQQQLLIDSILNGFMIPAITLIEDDHTPGKYAVLDGQQRLSAIIKYMDNVYPIKNIDKINDCYFQNFEDKDQEKFKIRRLKAIVPVDEMSEEQSIEQYLRLQNGTKHNSNEIRHALGGLLAKSVKDMTTRYYFTNISACTSRRQDDEKVVGQIFWAELVYRENPKTYPLCDSKALDEMYLKYKTSVPDQDVFNTINTIISYMEKAFKNVKKKLPASYTITQYLTIRRNMNILTTISPEEYYQRYVKNILEDKNIRHSIATLTKGGWNHSLSVMRNITTLVERAMLRTTIWDKLSNKNSTAA